MICSSWPHWTPFLSTLGLKLEWIYFTKPANVGPDWLSMCRLLGYITSEVRVFHSRDSLWANMTDLSAEVVFMSGTRESRTLMFPIPSQKVKLILTTGGTRRNRQATWRASTYTIIHHAAVGGVTDHIQLVNAWRPLACLPLSPQLLLAKIPRDMSTILNSTAEGGRERAAPTTPRVEPPRVLQLAPGLFHGFGHYPLGACPTPSFVVPSVFTKSKWVCRVLTIQERLLTLDFPEAQSSSLTPLMMQDIVRVAIPGKSLLAAWEITGGGNSI
jgi:hypothetical protein